MHSYVTVYQRVYHCINHGTMGQYGLTIYIYRGIKYQGYIWLIPFNFPIIAMVYHEKPHIHRRYLYTPMVPGSSLGSMAGVWFRGSAVPSQDMVGSKGCIYIYIIDGYWMYLHNHYILWLYHVILWYFMYIPFFYIPFYIWFIPFIRVGFNIWG